MYFCTILHVKFFNKNKVVVIDRHLSNHPDIVLFDYSQKSMSYPVQLTSMLNQKRMNSYTNTNHWLVTFILCCANHSHCNLSFRNDDNIFPIISSKYLSIYHQSDFHLQKATLLGTIHILHSIYL